MPGVSPQLGLRKRGAVCRPSSRAAHFRVPRRSQAERMGAQAQLIVTQAALHPVRHLTKFERHASGYHSARNGSPKAVRSTEAASSRSRATLSGVAAYGTPKLVASSSAMKRRLWGANDYSGETPLPPPPRLRSADSYRRRTWQRGARASRRRPHPSTAGNSKGSRGPNRTRDKQGPRGDRATAV